MNVVLGAGGRTGLECVKRLVDVSDIPTRAVVRDPSKLESILAKSAKLQIVKGDVGNEASLREVLKGARGVIFAAAGRGYWSAADVDFKVSDGPRHGAFRAPGEPGSRRGPVGHSCYCRRAGIASYCPNKLWLCCRLQVVLKPAAKADPLSLTLCSANVPAWCAQGVERAAAVCKEVGAQRLVLVSSMLVTKKNW